MQNICHLIDNMQFMKTIPDKFFDLAICDPDYGNGEGQANNKSRGKLAKANDYKKYNPSKPGDKYFIELFRISKNQIIWGGNFFINNLRDTNCFIVWDKNNGANDFADCELAWTSFDSAVRKFLYTWHGMRQQDMKNKERRIHINQKPVALYKWLLQNYAKPGQKVFDSHVGSGSIRIACYDMGFDFTGCEIDADYWRVQEDRFKNHISQGELFNKEEIRGLIFNE